MAAQLKRCASQAAPLLRSCLLIRSIRHRCICSTAVTKRSEDMGHFPGVTARLTTRMSECTAPPTSEARPIYQVMSNKGDVSDPDQDPHLPEDTLLEVYRKMCTLSLMDTILYESQRQGRISFYMGCSGEEAIHFGSAAALDPTDEVFAQYREAGVLLWRGYTLDEVMNQCYGNTLDRGKGRQMPCHYGSPELHYQTVSSPLATQMTQASGFAYALKRAGSKNCVICFFGDGAAQEGDAHAALNFAATLDCPVIFLCRNNGYAISTPTSENYHGDGIVSRGPGYGMESIRIDGNDFFAVYNAVKYAREKSTGESRPLLIEAMTYRVGHHSTSDDWTAYRPKEEVEQWVHNNYPNTRLKLHLIKQGLWDETREKELKEELRRDIMAAFKRAEQQPKPHPSTMFGDVYDTLPPRLHAQYEEMLQHVKKYPHYYPLEKHQVTE